jgi:excisionase family DNA binding protein
MLGVSRKTLWRIVRSGDLPVVRIDRRPRFLVEDVDAFVESRRKREGRRASEGTCSDARHVAAPARPREQEWKEVISSRPSER